MTLVLRCAVLLAALIFISVSATMNALFLSSLGRTSVEVSLLAAVSIAADIAKCALPVLLARAVLLRAWGYVTGTSVMLVLVILLSLCSGVGFTAATRGAVVAAREAHSRRLTHLRKELAEADQRIAALGVGVPAAVLEAELATLKIDRRWLATKACSEIANASVRQFCSDISRRDEAIQRATALTLERNEQIRITREMSMLEAGGAGGDSDQQATIIAAALRLSVDVLRVALTSTVAVIIEVGSVLLVLLAAGPMLSNWREPGTEPKPEPVPATLPLQADRSHWQRKRQNVDYRTV